MHFVIKIHLACCCVQTPEQIASRAARLGLDSPELYLLQETHIDSLCQQIVQYEAQLAQPEHSTKQPLALVVVDSIQTMVCDAAGFGTTGGVSQVRESMGLLLRLAKTTNVPVVGKLKCVDPQSSTLY